MARGVRIAAAACLAVSWSSSATAQASKPVEPIAAILETFKTYSLVAMSDAHGTQQSHAFRLALVRDPLPIDRRLRVLLGDPPIDWDRVRTREEWSKFLELRGSYPAALIHDLATGFEERSGTYGRVARAERGTRRRRSSS